MNGLGYYGQSVLGFEAKSGPWRDRMGLLTDLRSSISRVSSSLFTGSEPKRIGIYGPPNAGKTTLANRIARDWTGDAVGPESHVPHETRRARRKEDVDGVIYVLDGAEDPFTQVNTMLVGIIESQDLPVLILANKMDLEDASLQRISNAFPQHETIPLSALEGDNMDEVYDKIAEYFS